MAFLLKINQKKMKKLEKEYTTMKSKEKEEEIELRRMRTENQLLRQRIAMLETESNELADRLIQVHLEWVVGYVLVTITICHLIYLFIVSLLIIQLLPLTGKQISHCCCFFRLWLRASLSHCVGLSVGRSVGRSVFNTKLTIQYICPIFHELAFTYLTNLS